MEWIRKKFSRKVGFVFTLLLAAMMGLAGHLAVTRLEKDLLSDLREQMAMSARGISGFIHSDDFLRPDARLSRQVREAGLRGGMRLTLVRKDGAVLADSDVDAADIAAVENHAARPEIVEAFRSGLGFDIRLSRTTGSELLYAAVPFPSSGDPQGTVRLSIPLTRLRAKVADARNAVYASCGLAALAALFLVAFVSRKVSQPLSLISAAAEKVAEGQTSVRVPVQSIDEVGRLASSFNYMVQKLDGALSQLRSEKDEIGAILSNMVEHVVAVDISGKVLFINPAAEKAFEIPSAAATGKPFVEAIRQASISEILRSVLDSGEEKSGELRLFLNEERYFEMRAIPLHNAGERRGALLVLHDTTRIQKLEQVRKDFIANVSHELRTPLTAIQGFAETLLDGGLEDKEHNREFVQTIHSEAARLAALVNDLLDLSAIESGRAKPDRKPVALSPLLDEVVRQLSPLARKKSIRLEIEGSAKFPSVPADTNQIRQVFSNLIDNAIKFNQEGGSVTIRCSEKDGGAEISVSDTGSGIPQKDLPRVFERFYRVDKARSRDLGGTGLGLAIVKHIVESHGGSVRVESSEGRGSSFFVFLPKNIQA